MKQIITLLITYFISISGTTYAGDEPVNTAPSGLELSANVTLASDYLYRGLSQTSGDPAIQGGFDIGHASGFYIGLWASNVDFADSIEIDYYGGYSGSTWHIDYDIGILYYDYPGDPSTPQGDFLEYYASLSWNNLTLGVNYSSDFFAETGSASYYYANYNLSLPQGFSLDLALARQELDGPTFGTKDSHSHYGLGISRDVLGVSLGLNWSDTSLSDSDCQAGGFASGDCASTLVFSINKYF